MTTGLLSYSFRLLTCSLVLSLACQDSAYTQELAPSPSTEYAKDATTEINVKNADISAVVKIFSKKTKRNYILDERVKGKVSIYLPGKVTTDEALRILESVLNYKGFTSVPIGENLWKIIPSREARSTTIPTVLEESETTPSAAMVTRLLSLKYVGADEMKQLISPLVSGDGLLNAYTGTNSLLVIDSEDNIARLSKLIEELDVPFSNRDMTIVLIKYADAADIATKLNEILTEGQKSADANSGRAMLGDGISLPMIPPPRPGMPNAATGQGNAAGAPGSNATVGGRVREPKIIPDERTNSIIIVADEGTTTKLRALISKLDSKLDLSGNRFYVYRCQHANAEELAEILGGLVGGSTSGASSSSRGGLGGASSLAQGDSGLGSGNGRRFNTNSSSTSRSGSSMGSSRSSLGGGAWGTNTGSTGGGRGVTSVNLSDEVSVTADPSTNSLIISASKADYEKLKELLEKLDIKRRQVLVEAALLEVNIDEDSKFGFDWLTSTGGADGGVMARSDFSKNLGTLLSDPASLSGFTVAAASSGSLTIGDVTIPSQTVLLSALRNNNNVNILSSPTILTADNEAAEIVVGENVPFISSTSSTTENLNNTFNQVDRQDVGITLRITPQISSSDVVTLKVFTEVSQVVSNSPELGPTTRQRRSETTVITKDSQMIVTGGLIADDVELVNAGVPFLMDVPVLGHAFKSVQEKRIKRNLLIFITPHIVKDQFDARDVTIAEREDMERLIAHNDVEPNREDFLRKMDINRVTDSKEYSGEKPTTIRPPARKVDAESPLGIESGQATTALSSPKSNSTLELNLPAPKPRILENSASTTRASTNRYVLLELKNEVKDAADLPFPLLSSSEGSKFAALLIPQEADSSARSFFSAGQSYSYVLDDKKFTFIASALLSNPSEAPIAELKANNAWYALSPYELLNLGRSPWIRE